MKVSAFLLLPVLTLASCSAPPAGENQMDFVLDAGDEGRFLDTHFSRYGYEKNKSIIREPSGYRFLLPALPKGVEQTGVYSSFALAGNFEVSALYQLIAGSPPESGYGVTCGIALDTEGLAGNVSLARGYQMGNVNGYIKSQGKPSEAGMNYDSKDYPSKALSGRLVIKREKKELIFLVADRPNAETLEEIDRVPFTDATIKKVRFYADSGGSPTDLHVRLADIKIQAEEITGGIPKRDRGIRWGWWHTFSVLVLLCAGVGGFVIFRRRAQ